MVFDQEDFKRFILRDLVAIMECGTICLLPGWENSSGDRVEKALADFLGLGVMEMGEVAGECDMSAEDIGQALGI
jgi:hypothetical protein